jgi:hypothetical protein
MKNSINLCRKSLDNLRKLFLFQVFPYDVPVKNLLVVRESDQLIVLSEQEVAALSLHRCQAANKVIQIFKKIIGYLVISSICQFKLFRLNYDRI